MGVRFQTEPGGPTSEVVLHVRMWDKENILQQQALGIVGVNLIYAAFNYAADPAQLAQSLADNIGTDRIEVDMLRVSGPAFGGVDNRLLSLRLVQFGLTNAVMFAPNGEVLQPSEVLHHKAVLVERGSFRPVTHVNVDMLNCATAQFVQEPDVKGKDVVVLMEITMNNLLAAGELDGNASTLDEIMKYRSPEFCFKAVVALDDSHGGDGVLVREEDLDADGRGVTRWRAAVGDLDGGGPRRVEPDHCPPRHVAGQVRGGR